MAGSRNDSATKRSSINPLKPSDPIFTGGRVLLFGLTTCSNLLGCCSPFTQSEISSFLARMATWALHPVN
jgi:hypothetical protein